MGTCRIGDGDQDRPCDLYIDDEGPIKSWYLDTCTNQEEAWNLLNSSNPVPVVIDVNGTELHGTALLKGTGPIPDYERSKCFPLSAHMIGSGPLTEEP